MEFTKETATKHFGECKFSIQVDRKEPMVFYTIITDKVSIYITDYFDEYIANMFIGNERNGIGFSFEILDELIESIKNKIKELE